MPSTTPGRVRPVFYGTYTPRLDDKGRLILPARFREALVEGTVLTRGRPGSLYAFPLAEFARLGGELRAAQETSPEAADRSRLLYAGAFEEVPDKQGRITVPPSLRRHAGLERDCAVIGNGTRVEVWDLRAWEAYLAEHEEGPGSGELLLPGLR